MYASVNYFAYKQLLSHNTEPAQSHAQNILIVYIMYYSCKLKTTW